MTRGQRLVSRLSFKQVVIKEVFISAFILIQHSPKFLALLGRTKRQEQRATKGEKNHGKNYHESCQVFSNNLGQGFCV